MKNILQTSLIALALIFSTHLQAQLLPASYESTLNQIVENFGEIRGSNSLKDGKSSLRLLSQDKIILKLEHKRSVKTLTFTIMKDEEGQPYWGAANKLTIDMVNKYEEDLTKVLEKMLELSIKEAKL